MCATAGQGDALFWLQDIMGKSGPRMLPDSHNYDATTPVVDHGTGRSNSGVISYGP